MQIIITGGTGLIGRTLATQLSKDGHRVIVLSRQPGHEPGLDARVQVVRWDAQHPCSWGDLAHTSDAIVNLAGASIAGTGIFPARWTHERKRSIVESRVNAGQAVVQALKAGTGKRPVLIQASAVGYYGPGDD